MTGSGAKPTISDVHVALLRAEIDGDADAARRACEQVAAQHAEDGFGALTQAAFVITARREFAPTWSRPEVIRYVAVVRTLFSEKPDLLNPSVAENELRNALGESLPPWPDDTARATAQLILLTALVQTLQLDDAGVDELLSQARELAG